MNHFGPHPSSAFEGYYSKFDLPSGGHLALIVCKVRDAKVRPNMVSVTYVAQDSKLYWQREYWPQSINYTSKDDGTFIMDVPEFGSVQCLADSEIYDFHTDEFEFHARTMPGTREPWNQEDTESTPAGMLVHAPLPIQWHVHTLSSEIDFKLRIHAKTDELSLHERDHSGRCSVHHEKNWAVSFPAKYIWIQAWDPEQRSGLCVAGGEALPGVEAYLLTYTDRATRQSFTFTPPWTFGVFGFSPFCSTRHSYIDGKSDLDISNLTQRITISSSAPKDTFFRLSAPLPEGHRANFATQSFAATHHVTLYTRTWPWQSWRTLRTTKFNHGSLEFGGGYYDDAGGKMD